MSKKQYQIHIKSRLKDILKIVSENYKFELQNSTYWGIELNKVLKYKISDISNETCNFCITKLLHEIAHYKYSEFLNISPNLIEQENPEIFLNLVNSIEDMRIERALINEYPGTYDYFREMAQECEKCSDVNKILALPLHLNYLINIYYNEWGLPLQFNDEKVKQIFGRLIDFIEYSLNIETSMQLFKYIKETIYPIYKELLQQDQEDKKQEDKKQEDKKQENKDQEDKQEEEQENKKQEDKEDEQVKIPEMDLNLILEKSIDDEKKKQIYNSALREFKKGQLIDKGAIPPIIEDITDYKLHINYFYKKLNSILKDNLNDKYFTGLKSGKLNVDHLYKFKCENYKLFMKKRRKLHRKYNITLLVDQSGSMASSKIITATKATLLLAEVLNKCQIDFEVIGFNFNIDIYKKYKEKLNNKINAIIAHNLQKSVHSRGAGGNNDGFAIAYAGSRLKKQVGEKLLIVLSDGHPNENNSLLDSVLAQEMKIDKYWINKTKYIQFKILEEVNKVKKFATCIGIGIQTDCVLKYYPECLVIQKLEDLPNLLLSQIKKHIKRG